jgi:hypothetical protein
MKCESKNDVAGQASSTWKKQADLEQYAVADYCC